MLAGIYHQGMNTHQQIASLVHKVRLHPAIGQAGVSRRIWQDKPRATKTLNLHHPSYLYVTNLPLVHFLPSYLLPRAFLGLSASESKV